jgi:flagellar biogenesis protein FliO
MRPRLAIFWAANVLCALTTSLTLAQHPGQLPATQFTPLTIDEPRAFPPRAALEAQPLKPSAYAPEPPVNAQPAQRQPPLNVRLISGEQAVRASDDKPPLRLAPRGDSSRHGLDRPAAPTPTNAVVTVAASLTAVLGVFLVVVWCSKKFAPPGAGLLPKEAVELLGRAPLTARQQMQLVRVGHKLVLVSISPTGIEPLTEITDATEVEHLLSLCRRGKPSSSTAVFLQTLSELSNEPAPRGFVGPTPAPSRGGR